jgi:hypothetical protein
MISLNKCMVLIREALNDEGDKIVKVEVSYVNGQPLVLIAVISGELDETARKLLEVLGMDPEVKK